MRLSIWADEAIERVHSKVAQPGLRCPRNGKAKAVAVPEPRLPRAQ